MNVIRPDRTGPVSLLRLLTALIVVSASTTAIAQESAQAPVRIATEGAYPPFNYVENNEPAGFEVDLGRAICGAMKVACTFQLQDWDTMIPALKEGRFDAIMSSMEITPERRRRIAFSRRYYRIPAALIGPKDADPPKPGAAPNLAGKSVGTTASGEFTTYLEAQAGVMVRTFDKLEEADLDLLTDRIDYVLGDKLALSAFLTSREGAACCRFVADLPVDRGDGIGIGFRKTDTALLGRFDAAIAAVMADGSYDRIRSKYFAFDVK